MTELLDIKLDFGKFKDKFVNDVFDDNIQYFQWLHKSTFINKDPELQHFLESKFKDKFFMPFGKYKNQTIQFIKENDDKYYKFLKTKLTDCESKFPELFKALQLI